MKTPVVLVALSMLVALSFSAMPSEAKGSQQVRIVDTVKVDLTIDLLTVDEDAIFALLSLLPPDFPLEELSETRYVVVKGALHVDAQVWVREGMVIGDLHLNWRGTLDLLDGNHSVLISFGAKNAQVLIHLEVPATDVSAIGPTDIEAFGNLHTNAYASNGGEYALDLKVHVIFHFEDGNFTKVHIWLPEVFDTVLL